MFDILDQWSSLRNLKLSCWDCSIGLEIRLPFDGILFYIYLKYGTHQHVPVIRKRGPVVLRHEENITSQTS